MQKKSSPRMVAQGICKWLGYHGICALVVDGERYLAGNPNGPDAEVVPNITPHAEGLEDWSSGDIVDYLTSGMMPDGDFVGGSMADVIEHGLQYLTPSDAQALAAFIRSMPAHPDAE